MRQDPNGNELINLGRQRRKDVKKFRKGEGPLEDEIRHVVSNAVRRHEEAHPGQKFAPLVLVYERKAKRKKKKRKKKRKNFNLTHILGIPGMKR